LPIFNSATEHVLVTIAENRPDIIPDLIAVLTNRSDLLNDFFPSNRNQIRVSLASVLARLYRRAGNRRQLILAALEEISNDSDEYLARIARSGVSEIKESDDSAKPARVPPNMAAEDEEGQAQRKDAPVSESPLDKLILLRERIGLKVIAVSAAIGAAFRAVNRVLFAQKELALTVEQKLDEALTACATRLLPADLPNAKDILRKALIEDADAYRYCVKRKLPLTLMFDSANSEMFSWYKDKKPFRVAITVMEDGSLVVTSVNSCSGDAGTTLAKGGCRWYQFTSEAEFANKSGQVLAESARLAEAMGDKNPLWDVFFDGGKTVFLAVPGAHKESVIRNWVASSIASGMLCGLYIAGPDMDMGETEMTWLQDEADKRFRERVIRNKILKPLGKRSILATTSRPEAMGSLPHMPWMVTSRGVVDSLAVAISDTEALAHHGVKIDENNKTVIIQGFGDVGSGVVKLLLTEYKRLGFKITGVSDKFGAVYSAKGLDIDELMRLRQMFENGEKFELAKAYQGEGVERYDGDPDEILYKDCTALVLAAGSNIFTKQKNNISRIRAKLIVEGSNNAFESGLENILHEMGILYIPGPVANGGGIYTSTEEVIHYYMKVFTGLKSHVLDAISDYSTSITKTILAMYKAGGYKTHPYKIMQELSNKIRVEKKKLLEEGASNPVIAQRAAIYTKRAVPKKYALIIAASEIAHDKVYYGNIDASLELAKLDSLKDDELANTLFVLGRVFTFKVDPADPLRAAAKIKFIDILRSDRPAVVRRSAAEALSYVCEGMSQSDIKDTLSALEEAAAEDGNVGVWARWSLDKLHEAVSWRSTLSRWFGGPPVLALLAQVRSAANKPRRKGKVPDMADDMSQSGRKRPSSSFVREIRTRSYLVKPAERIILQKARESLPRGSSGRPLKVLDLFSGYNTYIPGSIPVEEVVGIGLNRIELAGNRRLTASVVQDLNENQRLDFEDGRFDAVMITSGMAYLEPKNYRMLFEEIARVLKSGGALFIAFTDDYYELEAVDEWKLAGQKERAALIEDSILITDGFEGLRHEQKLYTLSNQMVPNKPVDIITAYKKPAEPGPVAGKAVPRRKGESPDMAKEDDSIPGQRSVREIAQFRGTDQPVSPQVRTSALKVIAEFLVKLVLPNRSWSYSVTLPGETLNKRLIIPIVFVSVIGLIGLYFTSFTYYQVVFSTIMTVVSNMLIDFSSQYSANRKVDINQVFGMGLLVGVLNGPFLYYVYASPTPYFMKVILATCCTIVVTIWYAVVSMIIHNVSYKGERSERAEEFSVQKVRERIQRPFLWKVGGDFLRHVGIQLVSDVYIRVFLACLTGSTLAIFFAYFLNLRKITSGTASQPQALVSQKFVSPVKAGRRVDGNFMPRLQGRSRQDWGVLDFDTVKPLVDFNAEMGQHIIQWFPIMVS
ncbi:MAG: methyltransferase domain-containing protein, partial [Candidatus Omnitrophica bacterium]|nr:methyltransferase domain-containing protein [Candidatus Omnitrophota bacterium]